MMFCSSPTRRLAGSLVAVLAMIGGLAVCDPASARSSRDREQKRDESELSRAAGTPLLAIVAVREQRVTIYDAQGRILRAPVSTGQTGYETPAGIYSVIQKEAEHYSNLYDDASMPFMQRITWSGIALHAGALPGYPASHGCIRMPHGFAERLFDMTAMGMRVMIVPTDVTPSDITHPALFKPRPLGSEVSLVNSPAAVPGQEQPMRLGAGDANVPPPTIPQPRLQTLKSIAAAKAAEVDAATKKAEEARMAAARLASEGGRLLRAQRLAQNALLRAQTQLQRSEEALAAINAASNPDAAALEKSEEAKAKTQAKVAEAQAQFDQAKAAADPAVEALAHAREEAKAAEAARTAAVTAAKEAAAKMSPVSVFISRQTQRLYVRQAFQPIFDMPITIAEADKPLGTHVFTAVDYIKDGADVRWTVVSMTSSQNRHQTDVRRRSDDDEDDDYPRRRQRVDRNAEPTVADVGAARAALDRVTIPQEAIDRISEVISPGSALIISDEALSKETGKGTDFIVVMSGEPQGGIKIRRRPQPWGDGYERPYGRSPYGRGPSFWW